MNSKKRAQGKQFKVNSSKRTAKIEQLKVEQLKANESNRRQTTRTE